MDGIIKAYEYKTALLLSMLVMLSLSVSFPARADGPVYSIGVVPQFDSRRIQKVWRPILKELEARTGYKFRLKGSASIPAFEGQFAAGDFDFAYMNPYHFLKANNGQGYLPMVRDHGRVLQGILVVHANSPYKDVQQLAEKTIAFPSPNALGASLLIRAKLIEDHGLEFEPNYVKSHSSVYLNVLTGRAAAGGGVQGTLNRQPENIRKQLRVLYKTDELSPHPLAAHPRVPTEVRDKVQAALLQMGQTAKGQTMLNEIPIKKVGPASVLDYQSLQALGLDSYYVAN